jgi:4-hydroxybenzoate polyprenyltransferase
MTQSSADTEAAELTPTQFNKLRGVATALRPLQWVKNLLVLLPLLLAHKADDPFRVHEALVAFIAFCLCASGVYVINDLLDIELDRHHPRKRHRPFAAGVLTVPMGIVMAIILLAAAFGLASTVVRMFTVWLGIYFLATSAYSLFFKGRLLMDVILLAALYTLRLIAGAEAVDVNLSPWLLAFSMFFFISLAFVKRYSELMMLQLTSERETRGRGYMTDDLDIIQSVGPTSGYLAVLVFCQYISSDLAATLYKRPYFLWLVCPVLLYWITRIWFLARRRVLTDDPIVFALTDRMSWIAGGVVFILVLAATVSW